MKKQEFYPGKVFKRSMEHGNQIQKLVTTIKIEKEDFFFQKSFRTD